MSKVLIIGIIDIIDEEKFLIRDEEGSYWVFYSESDNISNVVKIGDYVKVEGRLKPFELLYVVELEKLYVGKTN